MPGINNVALNLPVTGRLTGFGCVDPAFDFVSPLARLVGTFVAFGFDSFLGPAIFTFISACNKRNFKIDKSFHNYALLAHGLGPFKQRKTLCIA